jgi:stage II sporulation protein D
MRGRLVLLVSLCAALSASTAAAAPTVEPVFVLTGHGWGHGIGMGQWGARGYALRGLGYERILAHYYPGTRLGPAPVARVRVLLDHSRRSVRIGSKRAFRLADASGRRWVVRAGGLGLGPRLRPLLGGKRVRLRSPLRLNGGAQAIRLDGRPYRGTLIVRARAGRLSIVNEVELERYLRGVVPYEMPHDWPREALRAQAVVARSYALATRKPGRIYDLLPDERSQVYGGLRAEKPETNAAVADTAGHVLLWRGRVATTFYHSTSGGRTAAIADVWPKARAVPYLRSVADPFDAASPHHAWGPLVFTRSQLARRLNRPLLRRAVDLTAPRNGSGRPSVFVAWAPGGVRRLAPDELRHGLGLRSGWIDVGVLALSPPREAATYGRPFRLRGLARGLRGVVVQRLERGRWRTVALGRKRADGRFLARVRPRETALYRVASRGVVAPPVRLAVAPALDVRREAGAVRGRIRPARAVARVALQRRTAAGWRTVTWPRVDAQGRFRLATRLRDGRYRASVAATAAFAAAVSRPFSVAP